MFNPETIDRKENTRSVGFGRVWEWEGERKRYFFNEWVNSYQFLPTFRRKYVFIVSFIFDYIPFVTEILAPSCESPLCQEPNYVDPSWYREPRSHIPIPFLVMNRGSLQKKWKDEDKKKHPSVLWILLISHTAQITRVNIKVNYVIYASCSITEVVDVLSSSLLFVRTNEMSCFTVSCKNDVLYADLILTDTWYEDEIWVISKDW